jgi:DNA-binding transcriptional MerR regulator
MDWPINEIARLAGTTSRTLRHYAQIGLLEPTRVGRNGYRYYDADALVRLQRILLLRELGLGLPAIAEVLAGQRDDAEALRAHLRWLRAEGHRVDAQISSVETTIRKIEGREQLMAEEMLDGFDHTAYEDEVVERWGADAYAAGDAWWSSKSAAEKKAFRDEQSALAAEWADAAARGLAPEGPAAHDLARRQYEWLRGIPGTPGYPDGPTREYFVGLGEMYVADGRFAANYGTPAGAAFVRDAMRLYADREL